VKVKKKTPLGGAFLYIIFIIFKRQATALNRFRIYILKDLNALFMPPFQKPFKLLRPKK
jgi:hypothetical protein